MKNNFNDCLLRLLKDEGGYTNDPNDSGGPTNFGITLRDYQLYINKAGTAEDVRRMDVADAKRIYKSKYWDALNCDSLCSGVDYTVFDYGVNSGLGRPRKALQRFKEQTGSILIDSINNERTAFLQALVANQTKNQKFLRGWLSRVSRVRNYSQYLNSKPQDKSTGPIIGGATVGIGATLSQYWHAHQTTIIISAVVLSIVIGTAIHLYRNRK